MGSAFDALNAPSSLTARRGASNLLGNFELPPPPTLQFSQRFPPLSTTNIQQPHHGSTNVGNLLTPPSNSASDASSTSSGQPSGNTPNTQAMPVLPYTPYWQNTTPNGYHTGFTPQPWQGSNSLLPPRGMFSPSLNSLMRNNSNSPAGESQSLPPPPYDLTSLPPFQNSISVSAGGPMQPQHSQQQHQQQQQQQAMNNSMMHSTGRTPSQPSPITPGDGLQRVPPTPNMYSGSQTPNGPQQSNYPYPGPSPVQQSPHSATVPVSRASPPLSQNGLPQIQQNQFIRPPPPSYSLPAMPGAIMQNVSNPGGPMSMMGSVQQSMLPLGFNSGYAANPQHLYGNQRAHSPQQASNDRPFKCDQCPQSFNRNHDLKRHKRIHLAVKPFPCGHCDKSFSRKDALKRHILVKGCGKGSTEGVSREDGTVKSESGSDAASDSPAVTTHM